MKTPHKQHQTFLLDVRIISDWKSARFWRHRASNVDAAIHFVTYGYATFHLSFHTGSY